MRLRAIHAGLSAAFTLSCLLAAPQAHAQKYRLVDLGRGGAYGINNDGTAVGTTIVADGTVHAATWSPTGVLTLTGEWPGDPHSSASHINDQGTVLGTSWHGVPTGNQYEANAYTPFVWNASTGLQPYPWRPAHPIAVPTAINNLGHITLSSAQSDGSSTIVLWRSSSDFTYIHGAPGFIPGRPSGINDQDQVIGQAIGSGPIGTDPAYFWSASTGYLRIESPSSGFSNIAATTINAQGQVGGYLQDPKTGRTKLFSWTAKYGTTTLMPLTSYEGTLSPISIDKTYRVIGNRKYIDKPIGFVWTILGGLKDINTLLVDNGTATAPIAKVTELTQVNNQGQISGLATIDGQVRAVRLDPVR